MGIGFNQLTAYARAEAESFGFAHETTENTMPDSPSNMVTAKINRPFEESFAFLISPHRLGLWAEGLVDPQAVEPNFVVGKFFGGREVWVRIEGDAAKGTIHYYIGEDRDALVPRIMIQVVAGPHLDMEDGQSVVSMMAWRMASMDQMTWDRLITAHAGEIVEIKRLVEAAYAA